MQSLKSRAAASGAEQQQRSINATEASKMLEAALQQMDGIISGSASGGATGGTPNGTADCASSIGRDEHNLISATNVLATAQTLALALQQVGVGAPAPDAATATLIWDWLETHLPRQDIDERLRRLQRDKESLAMQLHALQENVTAKAHKITELERQLAQRTQQLSASEAILQRQILSQSALETQKLELMSALSELKLHRAALERENVELKNAEGLESGAAGVAIDGLLPYKTALPPSRHIFGSVGSLQQSATTPTTSTHALSSIAVAAPKTPPGALRHQIKSQFHSLPRAHNAKNKQHPKNSPIGNNNSNNNSNNNNNNNSSSSNNNRSYDTNANKQRNVAFASNEKFIDDESAEQGMYDSFISQLNATPSPTLRERSAKGLRQIFGKLRRSNSGDLELPAAMQQNEAEFRRGGARATAGGRIEWSAPDMRCPAAPPAKDYADWTPQEVCNWLCDLGLSCYEEDCRKWLKADTSNCFFRRTPLEIERELHLKTPLHRKKIALALDELMGREGDVLALKAAQLDVGWVLRWLDDIGLPQYKDSFLYAKLDGRMLHRLTLEDLAQLHVTSCLHIASLRRGIQCMRENAWNPECLIRRSLMQRAKNVRGSGGSDSGGGSGGDGDTNCGGGGVGGADVDYEADIDEQQEANDCISLWTAHRVMEWLRVADLSEYAPNLRGAGVHGALMLYEPRFNADLLADLLSIPPSKTLLRRHLATHFKELLGRSVIHAKRDAEAAIGYQPLTIAAKLKAPKKAQFSLKRRKSIKGCGGTADIEWSDYVCPMGGETQTTATTTQMMPSTAEEELANNSNASTASTNNSSSLNSN